MQQMRRPQPDAEAGQLTINLAGDRETVAQLLSAMAQALSARDEGAPAPLYVTRDEAARRTGLSRDRLSALVKLGVLTNYGTPAKLRLSLAEILAWQEEQR